MAHVLKSAISTLLLLLLWGAAAWLLIGLLGSLRWLSPAVDSTPEAIFAVAMKAVVLLGFITSFYLFETFAGDRASRPADSLA